MEPESALPVRPARPILITLACLVGFAGLPAAAYVMMLNWQGLVAFRGWSFIVALIIFGAIGFAGLIGYWLMRRWGLYLYASMTVLSLGYALASGTFSLVGSLGSIVITAIGCAYFTRME
ncbi:MAG TPA: hypothetical protein VMV15_01480 [Candidatus Binataceae bacterium]|nr:hypothetical protein [Candidatus Binataceae bacterium]